MPLLRTLSASEQAAAHLREEVERGRYKGTMPGMDRLAGELGMNRKTIEAALRQLEHEGLLLGRGQGRRRLISPKRKKAVRPLRVAFLLYEPGDRHVEYVVELQHELVEAGHDAILVPRFLMELKSDVARIARIVRQIAADAWVVLGGSRETLGWFSAQPVPAFALFGRREGLRIAATGPDKVPAIAAATRHLLGLGHRRIVLLARRTRRLPEPGLAERAFLDELQAHGVLVGAYNLPDWEETREGFQKLLASLFLVTPPTALIIDEAPFFVAAQQFLGGRGFHVPEHVSLVCTDADPSFAWCMPAISHIRWDSRPVVRRIVRWAAAVSRGRRDVRQTRVPAEFVQGGTVGVAGGGAGGEGDR